MVYRNKTKCKQIWKETKGQCRKILLKEKLDLENIKIEQMHKVWKVASSSKRTIVAKLGSYKGKIAILNNYHYEG